MDAARQDDQPLHCHVCLDGDGETEGGGGKLVHGGCGCRGFVGFAHLPCLVEAATHNPDSWTDCPTCRQEYGGPTSLGQLAACWRRKMAWRTRWRTWATLQKRGGCMRRW